MLLRRIPFLAIIVVIVVAAASFLAGTLTERDLTATVNSRPPQVVNPSKLNLWNHSLPEWDSIPRASSDFSNELHSALFSDSSGKLVRLNLKRPIIFSAPWCKYCASQEKLFLALGVLAHITVVGVALDGSEPGLNPVGNETTVAQARATFRRDWVYYKVGELGRNMLYALSGNKFNDTLSTFPVIVIPHGGHLYVQVGYQPLFRFWYGVLNGGKRKT